MKHKYTDLFIPAPWGKLALLTRGEPSNPPVLMVHGRQDSAATFVPLVDLLPKEFYYVGLDLPGNGRSDPLPKGLPLSRFFFIHAIEVVVKHMGWKNFIFMGHSMGCEIGLFYNASTPGVISRSILLDPGPSFQRLQQPDFEEYYKKYFHRYYANYDRYNGPNKLYTEREAIKAVMKARDTNEEQARILLSRTLVHVEGDKYRLSTDPRSKYTSPQNFSNDFYLALFTRNAPPTLIVSMSEGHGNYLNGKKGAEYLVENMVKTIKGSRCVFLIGDHDHHVKYPKEIHKYVEDHLYEKFSDIECKL